MNNELKQINKNDKVAEYYYINKSGKVFIKTSLKGKDKFNIVKSSINKDGYTVYTLLDLKDRPVLKEAGWMVLSTFKNNSKSSSAYVKHIDGDNSNDNLNNLEWSVGKDKITKYKVTKQGLTIDGFKAVKVSSTFNYKDYYWVNSNGQVYKITEVKGNEVVRMMSPFTTRDGYIEYVLTNKEGKKKHKQAQRIVLTSFTGVAKYERAEVNHKDLNRSNNNLNNLEWVTPSENIKHSFLNGKVIWNKNKKKQKDGSYI